LEFAKWLSEDPGLSLWLLSWKKKIKIVPTNLPIQCKKNQKTISMKHPLVALLKDKSGLTELRFLLLSLKKEDTVPTNLPIQCKKNQKPISARHPLVALLKGKSGLAELSLFASFSRKRRDYYTFQTRAVQRVAAQRFKLS
jgi:hypothetical protein